MVHGKKLNNLINVIQVYKTKTVKAITMTSLVLGGIVSQNGAAVSLLLSRRVPRARLSVAAAPAARATHRLEKVPEGPPPRPCLLPNVLLLHKTLSRRCRHYCSTRSIAATNAVTLNTFGDRSSYCSLSSSDV